MVLSSCGEDEPARMEWDVAAVPADNFETISSPDYHPSVLINAHAGAGVVTVTCTNFSDVYFDYAGSATTQISEACGFTLTKTACNVLTLTFDEFDGDEDASDQISVWALDGNKPVYSSIGVRRHTL